VEGFRISMSLSKSLKVSKGPLETLKDSYRLIETLTDL
jgi:hypothetical protein